MPVDLEIVTPERLLMSRPIDMVVIPAAEGEMGVLAGHSPMIVLLRGGEIRLYENSQVVERLFVSGGFAEVTQERVTVLANDATPVAELSRADSQRRLTAAEAEYAGADKTDIAALDVAMDHLQSARAQLELAGPA
jgi:F-type H+-transporting ATPase subunit epsilon